MGVCVPNFRSVSLLVWPRDVTHINTYTNTQIHKYTSEFKNILGGCSPHVDFENHALHFIGFELHSTGLQILMTERNPDILSIP